MKDRVLVRVERMTTEPYSQNLETLDEARQMLPLLRQLNEEHFQSSRFIFEAIDELELALSQLEKRVVLFFAAGGLGDEDHCSCCGTLLTKSKTQGLTEDYWKRVRATNKDDPDFLEVMDIRPEDECEIWIIRCHNCLSFLIPAFEKLQSNGGFATCFI